MGTEKKKEFKWIWIIVGLFVIETTLRFLCSSYAIGVRTYKDELNYFQIAKSIWNSHSLSVYGVRTGFQKILYPILISPAFAIKNSYVRMKVINLLNSAIMSSSVFPAFLFAKKISANNKKVIALSLLIWFFMPDLCFSSTFMAEILYLPMGMWEIIFLTNLMFEENKKKQIIFSFLMGAFSFLLYIAKEDGLIFPSAFAVMCVYLSIRDKSYISFFRRCAGLFLGFGLFFIPFRLIVFKGLENYYANVTLSYIGSHYKLEFFFYALVIHLIFILFAWMFFSILLPGVFWRDLSKEQKLSYIFLLVCLITNAISITFAITVKEDLGTAVPRQHMRYYVPLFFPVFVLLFCALDKKQNTDRKDVPFKRKMLLYITAAVFLTAFVVALRARMPFVTVDNNTVRLYDYSFDFRFADVTEGTGALIINNGLVLLKLFLCVYVIAGCILVFLKNKKSCIIFLVVSIVLIELANNKLSYSYIKRVYGKDATCVSEAIRLNDYLKDKKGNYLLVSESPGVMGIFDNQVLDSYLSMEYCVTTEEQMMINSENKEYIDLSANPFTAIHEDRTVYYTENNYDYVIAYNEIPFAEGTFEDITPEGIGSVKVYHILTPGKLYINY
ncbi:MAG: hypothetical protein K6G75_04095 [Lachnospiraceae bacterium]|nr:hypothetical protein [Lachnospiraceae bacterium]